MDDAHHFKRPGDPLASGPGRGWISCAHDRLEPRAIVEAIDRGDFYASTGVELASYEATPASIALAIKATTYSRYRVQFIGRKGKGATEDPEARGRQPFKGGGGHRGGRIPEVNGHGVDAAGGSGHWRSKDLRVICHAALTHETSFVSGPSGRWAGNQAGGHTGVSPQPRYSAKILPTGISSPSRCGLVNTSPASARNSMGRSNRPSRLR